MKNLMFSKFRSSLKNKEKEMLETFPKQRKEKTHLYYHPFQSIEAASKKIKGNIRNVPKTKGIKKPHYHLFQSPEAILLAHFEVQEVAQAALKK